MSEKEKNSKISLNFFFFGQCLKTIYLKPLEKKKKTRLIWYLSKSLKTTIQ